MKTRLVMSLSKVILTWRILLSIRLYLSWNILQSVWCPRRLLALSWQIFVTRRKKDFVLGTFMLVRCTSAFYESQRILSISILSCSFAVLFKMGGCGRNGAWPLSQAWFCEQFLVDIRGAVLRSSIDFFSASVTQRSMEKFSAFFRYRYFRKYLHNLHQKAFLFHEKILNYKMTWNTL